jgi:DNA-binding NarL/FixJ family response regulator
MTPGNIRILLVDDHQILREGLRSLLESEPDLKVVAEAGRGDEAIQKAKSFQPDLIVMDLGLPDMNGLEVVDALHRQPTNFKIVVLSMHTQREFVLKAIELGCDAYVPKSSAHTSLLEAIRAVMNGERYLHPKVSTVLYESFSKELSEAEQFAELSDREQEVLRLTAMGFISREIAEKLMLSPKTVETYRTRAMEKLGLDHRTDLIRFALRAGILEDFRED